MGGSIGLENGGKGIHVPGRQGAEQGVVGYNVSSKSLHDHLHGGPDQHSGRDPCLTLGIFFFCFENKRVISVLDPTSLIEGRHPLVASMVVSPPYRL